MVLSVIRKKCQGVSIVVLSRGYATIELAVSVGLSVGHVTFLFSAPAHPSATGGSVYGLVWFGDTQTKASSCVPRKPATSQPSSTNILPPPNRFTAPARYKRLLIDRASGLVDP